MSKTAIRAARAILNYAVVQAAVPPTVIPSINMVG
jgi:hypothetical protein